MANANVRQPLSETTDDAMFAELAKILVEALDNDQERTAEVLSWIAHEFETRPPVTLMVDRDDRTYEVMGVSPTDGGIIWGMLHWESGGADGSAHVGNVIVYTRVETKDDDGSAMVQFNREVVVKPKRIHGPIAAEALYRELEEFIAPSDDEEPEHPAKAQPNGTAGATS